MMYILINFLANLLQLATFPRNIMTTYIYHPCFNRNVMSIGIAFLKSGKLSLPYK